MPPAGWDPSAAYTPPPSAAAASSDAVAMLVAIASTPH